MPWDITEDFEYVTNEPVKPRVCFGTGLEREVLPRGGPRCSPFMRRLQGETWPNVGPGTHIDDRDAFYRVTRRKYSTRGLGPQAPRFPERHEYQPPLQPPPPPKPWPQNCAPFNSTKIRKSLIKVADIPSSCDYNPLYKKKEIKFAYSFNGKKVLICPIQMKCVPYNLDTCGYCGCSCSDTGDYWQFENRVFLCREHYDMLFTHCLAKFQGYKLNEFKSVRDCFFCHSHNSCKAALKIMGDEEIKKKLRKEAYLDLYFPQRRFCDT